jgi:hypothetical protein
MRRGSLVTLGKTRADKKGFERMVMLQDLGGLIGREMPKPSEMPANARVETVPWKSHEVLLVAVREVEAGVASVTLNAQVPLTPKAIQVSVFGPQSDEAQLRQELRAIVASVEGPTNWGETGMAMTQERITRLSHGIGRFWLWGCLLVIAGSAAFKTLFRRKSEAAADKVVSPDRSEELTSDATNPIGRLLVCALVVYATLVGLMIYTNNGMSDLAVRMGYAMGSLLIPLVITGIWAAKSNKNWGWFRCGFTLVAMLILVNVIRVAPRAGKVNARENSPQPAIESQAR